MNEVFADDPALSAFRGRFPALNERYSDKTLVYLDNACTVMKPRPVVEAMSEFYLKTGGCAGKRSTHQLSQRVQGELDAARVAVADWIGAARAEEVVFTSGTTEAMNLVARGFPFTPGRDEVVLTELEHNSVFLPLFELAKEGRVRLRFCGAHDGVLDLERLESLIGDKTALVCLPHSSNVFGGELPVARAVKLAHRKGAKVLLDDAQWMATHREDVQALDVDFAAFSAHKMGGPFGVGVLYGKEHLLNRLDVSKVGGGTVKDVYLKDGDWNVDYLDAPLKFEAGIPNYAGILGLAAAIALLRETGPETLRSQVEALVAEAAARLAGTAGVRLLGRPEELRKGALVSFVPDHPEFSVPDFNLFLNHELPEHVVAIRVGEHCAHLLHRSQGVAASARLSFFGYNTRQELDVFFSGLNAYLEAL